MNTPFQHNDEFSASEQHLLMGALYGELSEEELAAWEHLKQQKPTLADEYTRLKQTTAFLSNNEQIDEQQNEQQNDAVFFDRQWQTLYAMMNEEDRAAAAPVPISLPSTVQPQTKRTTVFTLPQMQRWYGIAAMLVVAVGLGISVYRWQNAVSPESGITSGRREQDVQDQGTKPSSAPPSTSAQEQTFGTTAKSSPSLSRPNNVEGASKLSSPKGSSEARPDAADANIPAEQPRDAVKQDASKQDAVKQNMVKPEGASQEVLKKDSEEASKERPAERKQTTPASEIAQPAQNQPTQSKPEKEKSEQEKSEQTKFKQAADEARSTSPAPQAAPILDALKSLAVPQGGSGSSSGARQRLENNLQQAAPKRAAPASQATPHRAVSSTQPTLRVGADSAKVRLKMQDSTRNNK